MRKALPLLLLLLASACGGAGNGEEERAASTDARTFDVAESPPSAPNVGVSAAPGVAFNYRYAFRLPAERIATVQEQHAQSCERLGLARCRITGMHYRVVNAEDIEGQLAFKLDPAIARAFGKQGVDAVTQAEGMLVESQVTGEDVGTEIDAASRNETQLAEDLKRIEQQLARPGLGSTERAQLQAQAQQLRESMRSLGAVRSDRQAMLATTPVVFNYGSGDLVPGYDQERPVRDAIRRAGENFMGSIAWLLVALVTLLPWAVVVLLGFWLWRRFGPSRWTQRSDAAAPPTPPEG